jgi:hypothetical protein
MPTAHNLALSVKISFIGMNENNIPLDGKSETSDTSLGK